MKYATIVADPPWKVKAGRAPGGYVLNEEGLQVWAPNSAAAARDLAYPSMTVDEIAALNIPAADDAHLYLWTINRYIEDAYRVARAWGFKPSTMLVWAKTPFGGGLGGAWGISTEYLLFARRGNLQAKTRMVGTWFNAPRPYDHRGKPRHSAKPEHFYDMIEQVSPGPYLEMFARRRRLGWDVWGNEVESTVEVSA